MCSTDESEQEALTSYVSNYRSFLLMEHSLIGTLLFSYPCLSPSNSLYADILDDFTSIQPFQDQKKLEENFAIFLGLLGPLRPRYYSIASSPITNPNHLRIVYKVRLFVFPLAFVN